MLNSAVFSLMIGILLGFLTGLGIGGGSLLMLWLTLVLGFSQADARQINLLFFLPAAAVSCLFHSRQGHLNWRQCLPGMLSGCIAAALGSRLSVCLDTRLLRKPFGILLLAAGIREVFFSQRRR